MANSSNDVRFSKLRGRINYDTWKMAAMSYLVIKGLWFCTQTELADDANDAAKANDLKAWSEINLLLDESIYSYIAGTSTAKSAREALETAFEDTGLSRKVYLLKQLIQLKLSECASAEDYVNQLLMTSLKVKKAGLQLDEVIASLMLAGLPNEFDPLVMAIENSSAKLTTEGVKIL